MAQQKQESRGTMNPALFELTFSVWRNQAVFAALQLELPDRLKSGKKHYTQLAKETETVPEMLHQLLRALAADGLGFFSEDADGNFANAGSVAYFNEPKSMRWLHWISAEEPYMLALTKLTASLKSGTNAFKLANGKDVFDYLAEHPTSADAFNKAMTSSPTASMVAGAYPFEHINSLIDIGGGEGNMLTLILNAHPHIKRAALFDLPHVVPKEAPHPAITVHGGSFFEASDIPKGYSAYIMKHIIHDWDDEHCIKILRNCSAAMPDDGRILVVDAISPPEGDTSAPAVKWMSLWMTIATHGGKERTEEQFHSLFAAAGLKLLNKYRASPTFGPYVIEAVKAASV